MIQSKHITDFPPAQVPQIMVWAKDYCKVNAKIVEDPLTVVRTETINGREYLKEISVAGVVINPVKLNP